MRYRISAVVCFCALIVQHASFGSFEDDAIPVEPAELAKRSDLVGKKVALDDHVAFYDKRKGDDPDVLQLKRTNVTFLVPRKLRLEGSTPPAALVEGVLRRDGARLVCDVSDLKPVARDLDRLEKGVKRRREGLETRNAWARWAEKRGRDFKNDTLIQRSRELEAEAFRIETAMKRLGVDAPQDWLAKAKDARRRKVPEPEPTALAHRRSAAILDSATGIPELEAAIREIQEFFPDAASDVNSAAPTLARWEEHYAIDPRAAYREAPRRRGRLSTAGFGPMPTSG